MTEESRNRHAPPTFELKKDKTPLVHVRLGSLRARTLRTRQTGSLLLTGLFIFGLGMLGQRFEPEAFAPVDEAGQPIAAVTSPVEDLVEDTPLEAVAEVADDIQALASAAVAPEPEAISRVVELVEGRTFSRMLTDAGVSFDDAQAVSKALGSVYDHRKLQAGKEVTLSITRTGEKEVLDQVLFQPDLTKEIIITRLGAGGYDGKLITTPLERQRFAAKAEIKSSLFAAGEKEGVPPAVMAAFIRAYSHEVDFQRDLRAGDTFEVLYDQPTAKDGSPVGQGVVVYAALTVGGKTRPLYRVTFGDGSVDYFDERGRSVKRSLLRTPIEGSRVTSKFGMRRHPILGYSKMHQGVDFAAPTGTPVFAAGSGVVEQAKYNGAYGRFVLLRHNGRTQTAYAHMSRFAKGVGPGSRVNQGDIIGYVGSTGRSTGPHLHYEVRIDRRQVNPLSVSMPVGRVLEGAVLKKFKEGQGKIKGEFMSLLEKKKEQKEQAQVAPVGPTAEKAGTPVPAKG